MRARTPKYADVCSRFANACAQIRSPVGLSLNTLHSSGPLGVALRFGVDQTLETLIAVIQFMSENSPIDQIDFDERQPDLQQKRQRFREHVAYLLGQYRINQTLHATIEQARAAIGYDAARVAKIQAWLKSHSIEALDRNANNAQVAFLSLVDDLLKRAHAQGTKAEETAVRFLLADEFVRCNVFPNPSI